MSASQADVTTLVSVIVPTRNAAATLAACLASIATQSHSHTELIVVDNHSTDATLAIAQGFTTHTHTHGPERSVQRNYAAGLAQGAYLLFIDADMELPPTVIAECLKAITSNPADPKSKPYVAATIPEVSFGEGFWADCKALERSFYVGDDQVEAPRFMAAATFALAGRYDPAMAGGEDWDLSQRLRALGEFARTTTPIRHNEGRLNLRQLLRKRRYYAQGFAQYYAKGGASPARDALRMYGRYFSRPSVIWRHPIRFGGLLVMKTAEFAASAAAYAALKAKPAGRL